MNRLMRLACLLVLAAVAATLPRLALAQSCSMRVEPVLEFGTLLDLPTPATTVTARIEVTCGPDQRRVCVGIGAGTGVGSTEADRRMSMTTASLNTVGFALFKDSAFTEPFGSNGGDRASLSFAPGNPQAQTITIYGRLTPGQFGKPVGDYLSTLIVDAVSHGGNKPNCNGNSGFLEDVGTFQAHLRIGPTCTIAVAPLHFGTLAELTGTSGATNMAVTCTPGAPYNVGLDGGFIDRIFDRRMRRLDGLGSISYQLYRDAAHTEVWGDTRGTSLDAIGTGATQSIPVYGFVPAQRDPQMGSYSDTITATITY